MGIRQAAVKAVCVMALAVSAAMVSAEPIRSFDFSVTVDRSATAVAGLPAVGAVLTGAFSYDQSAPEDPTYPGAYNSALTGFRIDGIAENPAPASGTIAVTNWAGFPAYPLDQFTVIANLIGPTVSAHSPIQVLFRLRDETANPDAFGSTALPDTLDLAWFTSSIFELYYSAPGAQGATVYAHFTSLSPSAQVPEPATLALLLATLPGIALARRRRG